MIPAALLLLATVPIEGRPLPVAAIPGGVRVYAMASAEVIRTGRTGGEACPEDVIAQLRLGGDGRVIAEFR